MRKQVVRLTEGDLHRIIKESVNRILREEFEDEFEAAKEELRAAKASKDKPRILAAQKEYQRLKELSGNNTVINQPDAYFSRRENERRGIEPRIGADIWRVYGNMGMKKELDKDDRSKLQVNPELGVVQ